MTEFVSATELARELRVSRQSVTRAVTRGALVGVRFGRVWLIRRSVAPAYRPRRRRAVAVAE